MNLLSHLNKLINIASDVDHINGSLFEHLKGTYFLLQSWGAGQELCLAGPYHALYGTSGFNNQLISHNERNKAQTILPKKVEHIVYTYCACNRDAFWPQIGSASPLIFFNRFTNDQYELTLKELRQFCELTVANELEIAKSNTVFIKKYGPSLTELFNRMEPFITKNASLSYKKILNV